MKYLRHMIQSHVLLIGIAMLSACGKDDDALPAGQVKGTAAVGAALGFANVSVTDLSGAGVCTQAVTTSGVGDYACTLQSGKTAPFLVVVTDPSGARAPLVSIATTTPAAGASLTVNATPITTAIVGQLAPDGNALSVVGTPSLVDASKLASVKTRVLAQLANVLTALGAPSSYDPFSTPITAATGSVSGNTADQVIDILKFSVVNGVPTVGTVDNPAGAVPLADLGTTPPATLQAPTEAVRTLADAMRLLASTLNSCFALPVSTRVVTRDDSIPAAQGGPEVTAMASACEGITRPGYLHNGYRSGQAFYGVLIDSTVGADSFSAPELMRFIADTTGTGQDRAVLNLRYVDSNGVAGNVITVAQKFPGSATNGRTTEWWLYGNQQPVDTHIRAFVRRLEQVAPNPGTAPFANASASRFESGFELFINKNGPGSTGLRAARVTGPGLPIAGLVLTPPDASIITAQSWLNILRKDGNTDPAVAVPAPDVGNLFRVQRTLGLSGSDATTVRPNPNASNALNTAFPNWAHPLDYGLPAGSVDYIDFAALSANTTYTFELFYVGETSPKHTLTKTMLTPVVPAVRAANLQWVPLSTNAMAYLNPGDALAAATASMTLSWLSNPYAETIRSAGVYTFGGGLHVDQGLVGVARGATSAVATAPGSTSGTVFPQLTNDGSSTRVIQVRYRVLDGSYKDSVSRFN